MIKSTVRMLLICALASLILTTLPQARGESKTVTFSVGNQYVSATYRPAVSVSEGKITPNGSTKVSVSLSTQTLSLTINVPGVGEATLNTDPLAEKQYDIPGLSYNVGIGSIGLKLTAKGIVNGECGVNGSASLSTSSLSWTTTGSKEITLTTNNAEIGDLLVVAVQNIRYTLYVSVIAQGSILGQEYSQTLIPYQSVGSFSGSPSTVEGKFSVQQTISTGFSFLFNGSDSILWLFAPVTIFVGIGLALFFHRKGAPKNRLVQGSTAIISGVIIVVSLFFPWIASGATGIRGVDLGTFTIENGIINVHIVGVVVMLILLLGLLTVLGGYLILFGYSIGNKLVTNATGFALFFSIIIAIGLGLIPMSMVALTIDIAPWICIFGAILGIIAMYLER